MRPLACSTERWGGPPDDENDWHPDDDVHPSGEKPTLVSPAVPVIVPGLALSANAHDRLQRADSFSMTDVTMHIQPKSVGSDSDLTGSGQPSVSLIEMATNALSKSQSNVTGTGGDDESSSAITSRYSTSTMRRPGSFSSIGDVSASADAGGANGFRSGFASAVRRLSSMPSRISVPESGGPAALDAGGHGGTVVSPTQSVSSDTGLLPVQGPSIEAGGLVTSNPSTSSSSSSSASATGVSGQAAGAQSSAQSLSTPSSAEPSIVTFEPVALSHGSLLLPPVLAGQSGGLLAATVTGVPPYCLCCRGNMIDRATVSLADVVFETVGDASTDFWCNFPILVPY